MTRQTDFNLSVTFGPDLRECFNQVEDARIARDKFKSELNRDKLSQEDRLKMLTELGVMCRILGQLNEAEQYCQDCLDVLRIQNASQNRLVAAKLRLAHVYQWQRRFGESDSIFRTCIEETKALADERLLSFAYQHLGKSLFDQNNHTAALKWFYDAMMIRVRLGEAELADSSRYALHRTVELLVPGPSQELVDSLLRDTRLPDFVRASAGRRNGEGQLPKMRSNCINAVLNFFNSLPRFETASTIEALAFLQSKCDQVASTGPFNFGDVLAFWSRTEGGAWSEKKIDVASMDKSSPDFPFGLMFEHMAVYLDYEIIFHKPSPSFDAPFKFDFLQAAFTSLQFSRKLELTVHRVRR